MADAYRALVDVSFPKVISKIDGEGDNATFETEGVNYAAGDIIPASDLTPRDQDRAESGDLSDLVEPASKEDLEASQAAGGAGSDFGVFIAEHEAEAHAMMQYGHRVVPQEQALEARSQGAEAAAQYQEAVKEAGLDQRPVNRAFAQPGEPVPEEVLEGAQTPSGAPLNPNPPAYQGADQPPESAEDAPVPRERPQITSSGDDDDGDEDEGGEEQQGEGQ